LKLLLDANIFLEVLLDQERSSEAAPLLADDEGFELAISDFALHSLGLVMFARGRRSAFVAFLEDMILSEAVSVVALSPSRLADVSKASERFNLDFDDAYQYVVATAFDLRFVSFDRDFDRTDIVRMTPAQAREGL
jgi:predicted nucleic acid-binding protein